MSVTSGDVVIRLARIRDAAGIANLGRQVFTTTFSHTVAPELLVEYLDNTYTSSIISADAIKETLRIFVAVKEEDIMGFAQLRLDSSEGEPCVMDLTKPVELQRIYVDYSQHGGGLARALLHAAEEEARGLGFETIWLGVLPENTRAVKFYEKVGFSRIGEHEFWLGDHMDLDAIMAKSLV
jgi:ribosomal protein S18 acetylase RimI-like enzyme